MRAHWNNDFNRIATFDPIDDYHLAVFEDAQRHEESRGSAQLSEKWRCLLDQTLALPGHSSRQLPDSRSKLILMGIVSGLEKTVFVETSLPA